MNERMNERANDQLNKGPDQERTKSRKEGMMHSVLCCRSLPCEHRTALSTQPLLLWCGTTLHTWIQHTYTADTLHAKCVGDKRLRLHTWGDVAQPPLSDLSHQV